MYYRSSVVLNIHLGNYANDLNLWPSWILTEKFNGVCLYAGYV